MDHSMLPKIHSLKFEQMSFQYEGAQVPLFDHVDFDFPMGKFVWVKAASGSGRSTLLQLLAGLQMPTSGKYLINDQDVTEMTFEEFLPYRLAMGYGFDFGGLIHNGTLHENLMLPLMYHKMLSFNEAKARVDRYMNQMNISRYENQRPSLVQGGVRKIVCMLRALILHPQVVLLDDPSVGLGQEMILRYFDIIHSLRNQGLLQHVFISSFDEKMMSLLDHTEIWLDTGKLFNTAVSDEKKVVSL
ncbi:MAG: ABC transporter ATP-binding protein YtrE [Oligoflexia bacterium]|nr:MAG: ABC transporter ATP-binding protein YtrE [Oligoflexia bacterium]